MKKKKDSNNIYIALIILLSISANILLIQKSPIVWWDEAVYISIGKFMYSGGESGLLESLRPILLPTILGIFWKLGIDPIFAGRMIALASSIALIHMTYTIASKIEKRSTSILSAAILSITGYFIFFSSRILTDIPSVLLVMIGLNEILKKDMTIKNIAIAGIASSLAVTMRYTSISLIIPIAIGIIYRSIRHTKKETIPDLKQSLSTYIISSAAAITPYFLYMQHLHGDPFYSMKCAIITIENAEVYYSTTIIDIASEMLTHNPLLIMAPIGLYALLKKNDQKTRIFIIAALTAAISVWTIKIKILRYTIIGLPFLCILAAKGISYTIEKSKIDMQKINTNLKIIMIMIITIAAWQFAHSNITDEQSPEERLDIYLYAKNTNIEGQIIVTDPSIGAYVDNRITAFAWPDYAEKVYALEKNNSNMIFINTCDLLCIDGNIECEEKKEQFINKIEKENTILKENRIDSCRLILFRTGKDNQPTA